MGAIADSACRVLRNLAQSPARARAVVACGGIASIMAAMTAHPGSATVAEACCGALQNLAVIADIKPAIIAAGALPHIIDALVRHVHVEPLAHAVCKALVLLTFGSTEHAQLAVAAGGIAALAVHSDASPAVAGHACHMLWGWAVGPCAAENMPAIVANDCISHIMNALRKHPGSASVAEHACRALWNLSTVQARAEAIVAAGGAQVIVAAMLAHPAREHVIEACCGALGNPALHAANAALIVTAGPFPPVVAAFREHTKSERTVIAAAKVLNRLAEHSSAYLMAAYAAGAIDVLLIAFWEHYTSSAVAFHACWALVYWLRVPELVPAVGAADRSCQVIVKALAAHSNDANFAEAACHALTALAALPEHRLVINEVR